MSDLMRPEREVLRCFRWHVSYLLLDRYCGIGSFVEFAFLHAHYFLNFQRVFGGSGGDGFF